MELLFLILRVPPSFKERFLARIQVWTLQLPGSMGGASPPAKQFSSLLIQQVIPGTDTVLLLLQGLINFYCYNANKCLFDMI